MDRDATSGPATHLTGVQARSRARTPGPTLPPPISPQKSTHPAATWENFSRMRMLGVVVGLGAAIAVAACLDAGMSPSTAPRAPGAKPTPIAKADPAQPPPADPANPAVPLVPAVATV